MAAGGTAPAVLNAANEVAVEAFLAGRLGFTAIAELVSRVRDAEPVQAVRDLESVLDADARARRAAESWLASR